MDSNQKLQIDREDLNNVLAAIERSFSIEFKETELSSLKTYGDLCSTIIRKVEYKGIDDSTSKQVFDKLKEAIVQITKADSSMIRPDVSLEMIFPKFQRRHQIKLLEKKLGFELDLLTPKGSIIISLLLLMLLSFVALFGLRNYGFIGLVISFSGLILASRLGKEFKVNTIRDLSENITAENYAKARRWKHTINKKELEKQIEDLFTDRLDIDKKKLKKESLLF